MKIVGGFAYLAASRCRAYPPAGRLVRRAAGTILRILAVSSLIATGLLAGPPQDNAISLSLGFSPETAAGGPKSLDLPLRLPAVADLYLAADPARWVEGQRLTGALVWPQTAVSNAQVLAFLMDRDGHWYQALRTAFLVPGTNRWDFAFGADARAWEPQGHHAAWHLRCRLNPKAVGVRIFAPGAHTGVCTVVEARLETGPLEFKYPPQIRAVRPSHTEVTCQSLFELSVELPDRHIDPFDPKIIDLQGEFVTPDGRTNAVAGFYYRPYYRRVDGMGGELVPEGRPDWRIRYCPRVAGSYRYTVRATDAGGTTTWGPGTFVARAGEGPGFVRVATNDTRFVELDDGRPFFPIGHNIRSPFDTRMDDQFPWRFRHPEGSTAYRRYLRDMQAAGENLVEIWMCAWSLGLEWSPVIQGYHGAGDYHLGNAWELDEVLGWARASRIHVNLVLNNHGRASSWVDAEWGDHPYNTARGGFVDQPMGFFDHPRALELQRQLLRYTVARWGWDPSIFAWELWSEVNLTGAEGHQRAHYDPRLVGWHALMGDYLHAIDVNRHLVSTHVSNDYRTQNPELCKLPQLDLLAVDAYHGSVDPLNIATLVSETAAFNAAFRKPVLITEFGGSPMAAGHDHLRRELHAALWSAVCAPLAGTPLFWWWQLIEEQNLYPMYRAVSRFMEDVDRRDPALQPRVVQLAFDGADPVPAGQAGGMCLASPRLVLGWVFLRPCFQRNGAPLEQPLENLTVTVPECADGIYRVEYWDTQTGTIIQRNDVRAANDRLILDLPPLRQDVAFKIRPRP